MKLKVRGFEMAYEDTGGASTTLSTPPLLLLHGFPLDRTLWATQVRGLADIARVIAPDLRGFGESGMPQGTVTMDVYADDLRGLLDALGVKSAVVAGLSMGGYVALAFYRRNASRVRGLILADTKAGPDSAEGKKGRDDNIALARAQGAAAVGDKMLPKMLTPKTAAERPDVTDAARVMMARQSVAGVVGALEAMRDRPDSTPTLADITVPTLVVTGAEDTLIPPKEAEAMRDAIRGARLVSIPSAAHLANFEQPDAFNRAVREFLKSVA
ncbi:MAG: alpha/beta fold hydrolase [Chloroflexota bacterium]|nr:alpha/beta fold hydrolase [Chloroflexota bacterium]